MKKDLKVVGIGEILWDVFPDGKSLGGATTNFAYYAHRLGQCGIIASRVGNDDLGREILTSLDKFSITKEYIQIDPIHPTSTVEVHINDDNPDYIIHENVAWDFLELSDSWKKLAGETDISCFGTLSQRSPGSQKTILDFLSLTSKDTLKIYDMNLRQNFYSKNTIKRSLELASILKLNEDELNIISGLFGLKGDSEIDKLRIFIKEYEIDLVCCTKGKNGSLLLNKDDYFIHPGYRINIKDTVGAGDAFTAVVAIEYLNSSSLEEISIKANKLGALVSTFSGPIIDRSSREIQNYLRD